LSVALSTAATLGVGSSGAGNVISMCASPKLTLWVMGDSPSRDDDLDRNRGRLASLLERGPGELE
jgi:hypothetical protein